MRRHKSPDIPNQSRQYHNGSRMRNRCGPNYHKADNHQKDIGKNLHDNLILPIHAGVRMHREKRQIASIGFFRSKQNSIFYKQVN